MMTQLGSLELQSENEIDGICDDFESEWKSGQRPQIEEYLASTITGERSTLLFELVCVEAHYRRQAGEVPQLDEYLRRFPNDFTDESGSNLAEALALFPRVELDRPRTIGQFDLIEKLGEGAFGSVWKARDRKLDRTVAIKLPRGTGLEPAEVKALQREARTAAQLRHPNIVAVHDIEQDEETSFIVSAFVDGKDLKEWLKQNRPTFDEAVALCAKLAHALAHAHANGVIHRDLKPANILLDRAGEPHITDFGLAKRLSGDTSICANMQVVGTPAYMSPEQALGNSTNADPRTDVYSLGIIFYELLTGCRAFGGDQHTILLQVQSASPKAPREVRPEIPACLEAICLKAIAKRPDHRYQSVEEFAADLQRYQCSEPVQAPVPAPAPKQSQEGRRWSRRQLISAGLASVPLVGAAGWWFGSGFGRSPGYRPIMMQTDPAGAEVWFIPLDPHTGEPDPTRIIAAGKSPVSLELLPGDYLVEAVLEEGRFHEVYRRVPDQSETLQIGYAHYMSVVKSGGTTALPTVFVPDRDTEFGMARVRGGELRTARKSDSQPESTAIQIVPPFLLDPIELTCRKYMSYMDGKLPRSIGTRGLSDRHAIPLSFDAAMAVAERSGKRLLHASEFEFAATRGGTTSVAMAVDARLELHERHGRFGTVDDFPDDRIDLDPQTPIFGLNSNVAEWTITWANGKPAACGAATPHDERPGDYRAVCGGDESVIGGNPIVDNRSRDPRRRVTIWRHCNLAGLGVRLARSSRPRLVVADFTRSGPIVGE